MMKQGVALRRSWLGSWLAGSNLIIAVAAAPVSSASPAGGPRPAAPAVHSHRSPHGTTRMTRVSTGQTSGSAHTAVRIGTSARRGWPGVGADLPGYGLADRKVCPTTGLPGTGISFALKDCAQPGPSPFRSPAMLANQK